MSSSNVFDQLSLPATSVSGESELVLQSYAVSGGTIYFSLFRPPGENPSAPWQQDSVFVPGNAGGLTRYLALTSGKADTGAGLTATATGGAMGISRTAGTSLVLVGEATSSSAKTDKAVFEFNLPDSYVAGSNIVFSVNASVTGSGTLTGASTTMTPTLYTEVNGTETALTISAAQQIVAAGSTLAFTVTGTGLVPGSHVTLELVMLITSASGANTGQVNAVSYVA